MEIFKTIQQLIEEKRRIDRAISRLEARAAAEKAHTPQRRGRKNMSRAERLEVSARMKAYWAARRNSQPGGAPATPTDHS